MVELAPASNRLQLISHWLGLGCAYFLPGLLIDLAHLEGGMSVIIWPSAGIALVGVLVLGERVWPGIMLGQLALSVYHQADWQMVVLLLPGAVLQAIVGARLILRKRGMHPEIRNVGNALWFILVIVLGCSWISSTFASCGKLWAGHFGTYGAFFSNWWKWALGDALGIVLCYPFLMNWLPHAGARRDHRSLTRANWIEFGVVVVISVVIYDPFRLVEQEVGALAFLPLPILMWNALRSGMRPASLGLLVVSGLIVWGGSAGESRVLLGSADGGVLIIVGFAFMMGVSTLLAAASAEEYEASREALRDNEVFARRVLETTPNIIYVFDLVDQRNVYSNQKITEVLGYSPDWIKEMGDDFLIKILHPDDAGRLPEWLERWNTASDRELYYTEYRMKDASGQWHWFQASEAVFKRNANGDVVQIIGNASDVKESRGVREDARQESAFNESIVANAGEGICVCVEKPEFPFVEFSVWNEQMETITGYTMSEINEFGWYQRMYPDPEVQKRAIARMQQMRTGHNLEGEEWEITRKGGGKRQIRITTSLVMSNDGTPNVLGVMSDVTTRKESAAAIERLESLYRQAITAANAVPYMEDHTTEAFTFMGDGIESLTGYTPMEMSRELWNKITEVSVLRGERSKLSIAEAVQASRPGEMMQWQCDTKIRTKSGESRWVADCAVGIPGEDGVPTGSIGILVEITDRKEAEARLRDSEARFRAFLDNSPAAAFMKDREGRYVVGNAAWAAQFNRPLPELLGKTDEDLWDRNTAEIFRKSDLEAMAASENISRFEHVSDGTGTERWLSVLKFPVPRMGKDDLIGGISMDVTEQKLAENEVQQLNAELEDRVSVRTEELKKRVEDVERLNRGMVNLLKDLEMARAASEENAAKFESANHQLKAINQELEAFSYSISHDLRAPLRHIHGFVRLLEPEATEKLSPTGQHRMNVVAEAAKKMGRLIDDLLEFSRSGRSELKRECVDLNPLIEEVVAGLKEETAGREIEWKIQSLPQIVGDQSLVRQVLYNLISNAVKYTSRTPRALVEVGCEEPVRGNMAAIFVRDNGAGFDMKYAGKLFGVFQRLHKQDEFEGTGIGLANVRRIVHRHGGRIRADARPGIGATFHVTLPVAHPDSKENPAVAPAA